MKRPVIVVHGGAWLVPQGQEVAFRSGCRAAAQAGWQILQAGGTALDAVEAAVRVLEDDPTYVAGRGSYFNQDGELELDAIIMDGHTLNLGAVAAVQRVRHPISLARKVLEHEKHSFVVGRGATCFAQQVGIPLCDPAELLGRYEADDAEVWHPPEMQGCDTVGAVALDLVGNLAVATSTGGLADKMPGRVGDSPLVGCGAYADNELGAAAATGWGERLMRIVISKTACDRLMTLPAQQAADDVIRLLERRVGGYGGVILIDREGRVGLAHNTPHMAYAYITPDALPVDGIVFPGTDG